MSLKFDIRKDGIFKETFTQKTMESKEACRAFISAVIQKEVVECILVENETKLGYVEQKHFRFDFTTLFNDGQLANVEMQCCKTKDDLRRRFGYYLSALVVSQPIQNKEYRVLKQCFEVLILDFILLEKDKNFYHSFRMRDGQEEFDDLFNIIVIELPKIKNEINVDSATEIEAWAYFIRFGQQPEKEGIIKTLKQKYGGLCMAEAACNGISKEQAEFLEDIRKKLYDTTTYQENLETENRVLKEEVVHFKEEATHFKEEVAHFKEESVKKDMKIQALEEQNKELFSLLDALEKKINEFDPSNK